MKLKLFLVVFAVLLLTSATPILAGDAPLWLRSAANTSTPSFDKDVDSVVLLDEQTVNMSSSGNLETEQHFAIKVLTREGKRAAIAQVLYLTSAGKVDKLDAWVITPEGKSISFGKKETIDMIQDPDDIYNEYRVKLIDASGSVDAGYVFGFSAVTKETALFYQDIWHFQGRRPVVVSRYNLNLPAGWTAKSVTFNHGEIVPTVNGSSYSWELKNLAPVESEPLSPSIVNTVPWIAINFIPDNAQSAQNRVFENWKDVSEWTTKMQDPEVVVDDDVAAKARELTAGAETELDKIKAIGKFVQNLQYISVDIGVAFGNGYRPRPSNVVLKRGYGDCKDKANLMRALLRVVKIDSYPISIFSGDAGYVKQKWASPRQFNHAIIAVRVGDDTKTETVLETANLGRLLIFDPTDDLTPVGDLPEQLQGSNALIVAGESGELLAMPVTPPEFNKTTRNLDVKVYPNGGVSGSINESTAGQSSRFQRMIFRSLSKSDYRKYLEGLLTRGATAARLVDFKTEDNHQNAAFDLKLDFEMPAYGQLMQGRLLVFRPALVKRLSSLVLTESRRSLPIDFPSSSVAETTTFELPQGFTVDEVPDELNISTSFGEYKSSYKIDSNKLVYSRSIILKRGTISKNEYSKVKNFFAEVLNAEQAPVVLVKN
ncbi:MAG: DUF3857 domain-containing protein [Pyrinomonadaceae bacterium]